MLIRELAFPDPVPPGTHVRVRRGLYWHHAVYIGFGILIEFGSSVFGGRVARVHWRDFARGGRVIAVAETPVFSPQEIIHRAESQIGRSDFDVIGKNCEHFARWCTTGQWRSEQVGFAAQVAILICGLLLISGKRGRTRRRVRFA